jgi:hypothetical protein
MRRVKKARPKESIIYDSFSISGEDSDFPEVRKFRILKDSTVD